MPSTQAVQTMVGRLEERVIMVQRAPLRTDTYWNAVDQLRAAVRDATAMIQGGRGHASLPAWEALLDHPAAEFLAQQMHRVEQDQQGLPPASTDPDAKQRPGGSGGGTLSRLVAWANPSEQPIHRRPAFIGATVVAVGVLGVLGYRQYLADKEARGDS